MMNWKRIKHAVRTTKTDDARRFCRACGAPLLGKHTYCSECFHTIGALRQARCNQPVAAV